MCPCNSTDNTNTTSPDFKYIVSQHDKLHNKTIENIDKVLNNIFALNPEIKVLFSRHRHSLLPLIVDIGKGLWFCNYRRYKQSS